MSIRLHNLSKSYGKQAVVDNVSLEIEDGELFVLLGASGSGKSTLLRMIAGLTLPDSGEIWLHDQDVSRFPTQKRDTGFVFQNYSLFQHMTVENNIAFGLNVRGVARDEKKQRIANLMTLIDLAGMEKRLPRQLSGGQQQRVALARALAPEPRVLLLDEPFGALDVKIRSQLRENFRQIQKQLGVTAILVTHDQEEAFALADRIGVLEKGKLLEVGTPDQLYRRPKNLFTATFLGEANLLPARRNSHLVHVGDAVLPAPDDTNHFENQAVTLVCRPEEVRLSTVPIQEMVGSGAIQAISFAGSYERVTIEMETSIAGNLLQAYVLPAEVQRLGLQAGQNVYVSFQNFYLLEATG